jgi:hypothetical protein
MASTRGEEREGKKKKSSRRRGSRETHLFAAETCRGTSARGGTSRPRARACRAGTTSNPPGPGASPRCRRSNASRTAGKKQSQVSFVFSVFSTPFARVARMGKACSARFLRAAAVQTREEAMEGVGARARAMATSAAIAIVRSGSRCGNVRREVAPASDRVERGVVAVAVAPSARVALGKDALSRLFAHLNKCPFST